MPPGNATATDGRTLPARPQDPVALARAAVRSDGRSLVLVGLMGAGKTTVGRRLARTLAIPFVDADAAIEDAAGQTIADMFAMHGEPYFRDGERRVIQRLMRDGPMVLATGGGAFIDPATRALILGAATAIWLDADIDVLVKRVSRHNTRPLLVGRDPGAVLRDLAAARNPVYALAPIRIASNAAPHDATVRAIVAALAKRTATPVPSVPSAPSVPPTGAST